MTRTENRTVARPSISRAAAAELIVAARTAAAGVDVAIAVTGADGHLRAFESMDRTPFLSHAIAIDKAWTAAAFRMPTHIWADALADPAVAQLAHRPRLVAVGGGFPVVEDGVVIGGIGVSGGSAEQDQRIAAEALRALGFDGPG